MGRNTVRGILVAGAVIAGGVFVAAAGPDDAKSVDVTSADTAQARSETQDSDEATTTAPTTTAAPTTTSTTAAPATTAAPTTTPPTTASVPTVEATPVAPTPAPRPAPRAVAPPATAPPATAPPATAPPATAAPAPPPPPPPPAPSGVRNGARDTSCESYMVNQINTARRNAGRATLANDTGIQSIPVAWSDTMAGRRAISHNPNYANQILQYRDYRVAAENVGTGPDLGALFQAFMQSPGHRDNILRGDVGYVSVGCVVTGGAYYVTQNFWG